MQQLQFILCNVQDSITRLEEYNAAMKRAVQEWHAACEAPGELPSSNARHIRGGTRPLTGSEARTVLAQ